MAEFRCAVVGSPVAHSLSPILHRAAYAALGLTGWTYDRVEMTGSELGPWLSGLDDGWRAVSVTMPAKQAALAAADSASNLAHTLGAANTLVRRNDGWHAENTDVAGLLGALREAGVPAHLPPCAATVIGAGGTAAAALAALAALGQKHVDVVVRSTTRAFSLLAVAERLGITTQVHPWPESAGRASPLNGDLVISTVPALATEELAAHPWTATQTVLDVTYDPWPPALVTAARAQGSTAIGGAGVLLWQAVAQVELMTGRPAPVEAMRAALFPGGSLASA